MSLNLGVLSAAVTLSDTKYVNTLNGLEQKSDNTFKKIGDAAKNYLSVNFLVDFGKKAIKTFSELEEATNKFNVVFAGFTDKAGKSVDELIEKFGQSELSAKQMLSGTGDILTGFGFDRKAALDMSVLAAKLGADLASFSNYAGGAKGASEALTKAMLGETEMAKMLGIVIRQDSDEFKQLSKQAMETGLDVDKSGNVIKVNTEQQAKALAALALAYQQSPNAIGDFVRSQDSIANQTQILNNRLTELYSTIGKDGSNAYADALQGINALLAGYVKLDAGTKSLINNAVILSGSFVLMNKFGILKVTSALATGTVGITKYAKHLLMLKNVGADVAFSQKKLAASIQASSAAVNGALIALTAIVAGLYAMYKYSESRTQNMVDVANERLRTTREETSALEQLQGEHKSHMERLEELAKYEKLTNDEQTEAKKLAGELTKAYGELGISIDTVNGKLSVSPDAWAAMEYSQKQKYIKQLNKEIQNSKGYAIALQKQLERSLSIETAGFNKKIPRIAELRENYKNHPSMQIEEYSKMLNYFTDKGYNDEANITEKIIKTLKEQIASRQKLLDFQENGDVREQQRKKRLTEEQRNAIIDVEKTEWDIEFDSADTVAKAKKIKQKIDDIFKKNNAGAMTLDEFLNMDRTRMTTEQINALKQILLLRDQEIKLTAKAADEENKKREAQEKELADARRRKTDIEEQHQEFLSEQVAYQIEVKLKNLEKTGDKAQYDKFVQQELAKASKAAAEAERAYMTAYKQIQKKGTVDKDSEGQLQKLLRAAQEAQNKQKSWENRARNADETPDKQQEEVRKVAGSWSLAEFSRQQENSVESKIEKNTRETARLLRNNKGMVY